MGPGEACDDGILNSDTRANACRTHCQLPGCGDGVIDAGERCDGRALSVPTCRAYSSLYDGGKLGCHLSCWPDASLCSTCGDAVCETPAENALACAADCAPGQIVSGALHSCLVKLDGTVWCWGDNQSGQLGNGTRIPRSSPVQVLGFGGEGHLGGVVALTAGAGHTCALHQDGLVSCWGSNGSGQLGHPGPAYSLTPITVRAAEGKGSLGNVADVAAGDAHTCAIRGDGAVFCWGEGRSGQLGHGRFASSERPVRVVNPRGELHALSMVKRITLGADHTCAMNTEGRVYCWGEGDYGQLGTGLWVDRAQPYRVQLTQNGQPLRRMQSVQAGDRFTCALGIAGDVFCWGHNRAGQLGDAVDKHFTCGPREYPTDCAPHPVQVTGARGRGVLHSMRSLAAGGETACALTDKGAAYCWGSNLLGQIGDGRFNHQACGSGLAPFDCARWPVHVATTGKADPKRTLGAISLGRFHVCALTEQNQTLCWGSALSGVLGDGNQARQICSGAAYDYPCRPVPDTVFEAGAAGRLDQVTKIVAGWAHACALTETGSVWCWGRGEKGQLGDGLAVHDACIHGTDCLVNARHVAGDKPGSYLGFATDIAAGDAHTCAVLADSTVRCWGVNLRGQLGNGTQNDRTLPAVVKAGSAGEPLAQVTRIAAGLAHTCAIRGEGELVCFGSNQHGQLGDGTLEDRAFASAVVDPVRGDPMLQVADVATGAGHTCAVQQNGTVFCWGANDRGQLGNGTRDSSLVPVQVRGPAGHGLFQDAVAVVAGWSHTCALRGDGTVYCWGDRALGNTALGEAEGPCWDQPCTLTPLQVRIAFGGMPLTSIRQLSAAKHHTCAVSRVGNVLCWGHDKAGALGRREELNVDPRNEPIPIRPVVGEHGVGSLRDVVGVAAGGSGFSCAIKVAGGIWCWGRGTEGQMGDGYLQSRVAPRRAAARAPDALLKLADFRPLGRIFAP